MAYARHVERPGWGRYAVLLACLLLGLLSKPLLVTFPCVLLLLDHWPLRRLSRRAWLEKLPMFALVGIVAAITVAVQRGGAATAFADYYDLSLASRLANAIDSYVGYLGQSFWPSGLAVHYPHPRETLAVRRVVLAALLLLTCSGLAAWSWRRRPWLAVGWLWFLGVLVPMLGLVQVGSQARADRYMYVPLVGLAIALAWGVPELLTRLRAPRGSARLLGCAVVLGLAAAAWLQVGHWRGSATLFAHAVAVEPESFFGNRGLGLVRIEQGRWQEAELLLERGFALRPDQGGPALVRLHLLQARRAQQAGEVEAFRARLTRVLEIEPAHPGASGILGVAAVREGRFVEARPLLERALAEPDAAASVHAAMGMLELVAGNGAAAARHSRAALRLDPQLAWAANNLAWILATSPDPELRDPEQAVALAEQVVAGEPDPDPNHLDTLAAAYAAAGRGDEAVATAERGIRRAEAEGQPELAATLRARRAHYRAGGSLSES